MNQNTRNQNQPNPASFAGAQPPTRSTQVSEQLARISDANDRLAKAGEALLSRLQTVIVDRDPEVAVATKCVAPTPLLAPLASKLYDFADQINANAGRLEELASAIEL